MLLLYLSRGDKVNRWLTDVYLSQLEASLVFSNTEELWYYETVCQWMMTIYIYIYIYISPGGNTPQNTNCTATCPLSRKLFKLDEPDMQNTAGEAGTNS